jgi:uncharacterized protein YciI
MMLVCRIAWDAEGKDFARQQYLPAHKDHLRSGVIKIVHSGPLFLESGAKLGALIVFDVADFAEVDQFNSADPYVEHGVYGQITIARWDKTI